MKDDPSAVPVVNSGNVKAASGHVATVGHPADGVVINEDLNAHHTTHHHHGHHHHAQHETVPVATTTTTTTQQQPAGSMAARPVHTLPSGANGDGLVVASNLGGPLGGSVVLGGQCECLRNGGTCGHGAGQCSCRGCTTAATSINPGINIGVSTHQYTAPVGTTGIGGGVADPGVGMAGMVNSTNPIGQPVSAAVQNCDCVRKAGVCNCAPGQCSCTNCTAHRKSLAATQATSNTGNSTSTSTYTTTTQPIVTSSTTVLGGSEYVGGQQPNYTYGSSAPTTGGAAVSGGITGSAVSDVPVTDNSNVPYKASDYIEGKPVNSNRVI